MIEYVPRRLLVLRTLRELIEGTHWQGGTLAGCVSFGKTIMGDEVSAPWVNIIESPRPDYPAFGGESEARADNWVLLVQGFVDRVAGDEESSLAYELQAEVEIQLSKPFLAKSSGQPMYSEIADRFSKLGIFTLQPYPPVIRDIQNISSRMTFYQPLTVGVSGLTSNPFVKVES